MKIRNDTELELSFMIGCINDIEPTFTAKVEPHKVITVSDREFDIVVIKEVKK